MSGAWAAVAEERRPMNGRPVYDDRAAITKIVHPKKAPTPEKIGKG
jgi:hypothetical protein